MVAPASVEKCRRGRPGENKLSNFRTLGYASFSECMQHESQGRSRASNIMYFDKEFSVSGKDVSLQQQICSHVGQAFKTSDRLFDTIRGANLTGVGEDIESEVEHITDTLHKATHKCHMTGVPM